LSKIKEYSDAEKEFGRWLEDKYPNAKNVKFKKIWKNDDLWMIEGELQIQSLLVEEWKQFKLQMTVNGKITGYEIIPKKKQK